MNAIEFIEVSQDFYVTTNKKVGILSNEGAQKIEPSYDDIKVLDNDLRLYYVKNGNYYGVLDKNGKRVVYIEYEKIGVDTTQFKNNGIKNSMLLFDNCIPVMKAKKWGAFDVNGNQIIPTNFDSFGCINSTQKDTSRNNVLIIPEVEGIVVSQNGKYGIIDARGKYIAPCAFDSIYSITNLGQDTYYLEYNGQQITISDYVKLNQTQSGDTQNQTNTVQPNDTNTVGNDVNNLGNTTIDNSINVNSNITVPAQ